MRVSKQVVVPDFKAEENGIVLEVTQEINAINPREWAEVGTMVCWHKNYILGDKQIKEQSDLDGILLDILDEKFEFSEEQRENVRYYANTDLLLRTISKHTKAVVLPLYLFDHSGISISTSSRLFRMMDSAGWDWRTVGIVYSTEKTIKKEYKVTEITDEVREKAIRQIEKEVEAYDLYLRGEVYSFRLYNKETGEEIDSCGGIMEDSIEDLKANITEMLPEKYKHIVDLLETCNY